MKGGAFGSVTAPLTAKRVAQGGRNSCRGRAQPRRRGGYGLEPMKAVGGFVVLLVRGVLLWVLVPVVSVAWVLSFPLARLLGHRVALGQALGWADLNMTALLQRGLPTAVLSKRLPFVPWREMGQVSHRIQMLDPA